MIDNIKKDALKEQDDLDDYPVDHMTDEEWIDYLLGNSEPEEKYNMKCIRCGYEEKIPAWIVGEFAGENRAMGKTGEVALECPRCNGAMYRKQ